MDVPVRVCGCCVLSAVSMEASSCGSLRRGSRVSLWGDLRGCDSCSHTPGTEVHSTVCLLEKDFVTGGARGTAPVAWVLGGAPGGWRPARLPCDLSLTRWPLALSSHVQAGATARGWKTHL